MLLFLTTRQAAKINEADSHKMLRALATRALAKAASIRIILHVAIDHLHSMVNTLQAQLKSIYFCDRLKSLL